VGHWLGLDHTFDDATYNSAYIRNLTTFQDDIPALCLTSEDTLGKTLPVIKRSDFNYPPGVPAITNPQPGPKIPPFVFGYLGFQTLTDNSSTSDGGGSTNGTTSGNSTAGGGSTGGQGDTEDAGDGGITSTNSTASVNGTTPGVPGVNSTTNDTRPGTGAGTFLDLNSNLTRLESAYKAVGCGNARSVRSPITCPGSATADDYSNVMDYLPDGCRVEFNRAQVAIMISYYYLRYRLSAEGGAVAGDYPGLVVNRCLTGGF
jgi:hypothetical protein